jgi:DNA-binding CsgD family transcriptional regulator/PAS domain-containing protein
MRDETLLRIIGEIYDAGGDPRKWAGVLTSISDALGGVGASLLVHDLRSSSGGIAASVRVDPEALRLYGEHYVRLDPWLQRAHRTGRIRPGLTLTGDELIRYDEFLTTPYCQEFAARFGITRFLGGAILVEGPISSSLSLLRDREFSEEEVELVRELMPHLARALQWHHRVGEFDTARAAAAEALERLPLGIIVIDERGKPLLVNAAARSIIDQRDGIGLASDGLACEHHEETLRLRRLIARSLTRRHSDQRSAGGAVCVSRPSQKRAYYLLVTPLSRNTGQQLGSPQATAAIFLSDPENAGMADTAVLQQLHGLTPTEARIAASLAAGLSMKDVADAQEMTLNTARWHAKHVFAKTDTAGQSELVRLVLTGPATVIQDSK